MKRRRNCIQTHLGIQHIIDTGEYVTTVDSWSVGDEMMRMNHENLVYRLSETVSDSFLINIVSYFLKGRILLNKFNKIITSLVKTGLIIKEDGECKKRPVTHRTGDTDTQDEYFVFTLSHLQVAFHVQHNSTYPD